MTLMILDLESVFIEHIWDCDFGESLKYFFI
jgi:hypothetical protein